MSNLSNWVRPCASDVYMFQSVAVGRRLGFEHNGIRLVNHLVGGAYRLLGCYLHGWTGVVKKERD